MKQQTIYVLVDASRGREDDSDTDVANVLLSIADTYQPHPARELRIIRMRPPKKPVAIAFGDYVLSERGEEVDFGLYLSEGLDYLTEVMKIQHHRNDSVYVMMILKDRSVTPIARQIEALERMTQAVKPFLVVACHPRAWFHRRHVPTAKWVDHEDQEFSKVFSEWIGEIPKIDFDAMHDSDYTQLAPHASLQSALQTEHALRLLPLEYKGPIYIDRPLHLDGRGATIWGKKGPVLVIRSDGVRISNLRIEITGANVNDCAVDVRHGKPEIRNVIVRGAVLGLPNEEGKWKYPLTLDLKAIPSRSVYRENFECQVPVPVRFDSQIAGLRVRPERIAPGRHWVELEIEPLPSGTLISGTVSIVSDEFIRHLYLRGSVGDETILKSASTAQRRAGALEYGANRDVIVVEDRKDTRPANCSSCGKFVSNRVKQYCLRRADLFGGKIYCFEHQRAMK